MPPIVKRFSEIIFFEGDTTPYVYANDGTFEPLPISAPPFVPSYFQVPTDDDQVFNGNGSGGAIRLGTVTILANANIWHGELIWDFQNVAVQEGSIVLFSIFNNDTTTDNSIDIRFNNVTAYIMDSTNAEFSDVVPLTFFGLYFDGAAWQLLTNQIHVRAT